MRGERRVLVALVAAALVGSAQLAGQPGAAAADSCTSTDAGTYVAQVCLDETLDATPLRGNVAVRAHVVISPRDVMDVVRVVFLYGGQYLLTDFYPDQTGEYEMAWRTGRSTLPSGAFTVRAWLGDGRAVDHTVPVTVADAGTVAANPPTFSPRTGTVPSPGARFRLAAVGDAVVGSDDERALAAMIATRSPNLLAYLGDVYERGSPYEFDNWYADRAGFGRFRDITDPTVGNHEYETDGAAGYFDFWGQVPHYYSLDVAGWHLVSIDSSEEYDQLRPGTAQYDWLSTDLAGTRSRCTVVFAHHPRYAVGVGGGRAGLSQVWALLADRRVTLALAGHTHHYERWVPMDGTGRPMAGGVTEIVAGTGGHKLGAPVTTDTRVATTVSDLPGALMLDLGPDDARFGYVTVDGAERDSGTIPCAGTGDNMPPTTPGDVRVSTISPSSAHLRWSPSTDELSAVTSYTVRRDGVAVASVPAGTTAFFDGRLRAGRSYRWSVDAVDTSANHSTPSPEVSATTPGRPARVPARTLLRGLRTASESRSTFRPAAFSRWVDADQDGCDTRREVLLRAAVSPPSLRATCWVVGGLWRSPYDAARTADQARLRVWRLVPPREAWQSGARRWTGGTRLAFANDLGFRPSLDVVTDRMLDGRGARDPTAWLPPRSRCGYVAAWVAVKWRWRLAVDPRERAVLSRRLGRCGWPTVEKPTRAAVTVR